MPDPEGNNVKLEDFRGHWLVLYFYPKDNTPGCTLEAKDFTCLLDEFDSEDCRILGVSPDSEKSHLKFIDKHELKVALLSDASHEVLSAYGAWGLKKRYGREFEGVIRSTFLIDPEGTIAGVWYNVRTKGHAEKVLEELKKLRSEA